MEKEENNSLGFIEIIQLLLKRWFVIVLITAICGVLGYFVGVKTKNVTYVANSSFLIRINGINTSSSGYGSTSESSSWSSDISTSRYLLGDCIELMKSDACLEEITNNVNANIGTNKFTKETIVKYFSFSYDGSESLKITVKASSTLSKAEAVMLCNQMVDRGNYYIDQFYTEGDRATVTSEVLSVSTVANTGTTSSSVLLKTVVGALVGVVVAVFAILLINMLDTRIKNEDELAAKLELPVLACIPSVATNNVKKGKGKGGSYGA